ncbi:MAG: DUF167 domain-containing protein [Nanoarchaeota archaeon]
MLFRVVVKPSSGRQEVQHLPDGFLVRLKSPAQDNKANLELIKVLSKFTKRRPTIVRGATSRTKWVRLD